MTSPRVADYRRIKPVQMPAPYRLMQDWHSRWQRMQAGADYCDEHEPRGKIPLNSAAIAVVLSEPVREGCEMSGISRRPK